MADQTPDSAERIAEDARSRIAQDDGLEIFEWSKSMIEARINSLVLVAAEKARGEQATAIRARFCPLCAAGRPLRLNYGWWHCAREDGAGESECHIDWETHIILGTPLGTPTGGPDE